tara:strand:- start:1832 stop:2281 length:450 start_codon:yes stop_codon:yes gene_type:complete
MIEEQIKITGNVDIVVTDKNGGIKEKRSIKNLVLTTGKTFIAASMLKTTTNSPVAMTHMAIGSGTTAAVVGNTAMETSLARVALATATSSGAVVTYTASFPAGTGTGAVTEAGTFNDASAGTMLCRTVFSVVNKGADDAMSITWTITVS